MGKEGGMQGDQTGYVKEKKQGGYVGKSEWVCDREKGKTGRVCREIRVGM